jgi:hypothetical protein
MADARLKILVNAEDHASSVLGGIGRALSGVGRIAAGVAAAGVGLAAGALVGLGKVLVDSVGEATAAQQGQAQLAAVLKSTGGAAGVTAAMANELATALSEVTRYEDDAILAGENMLLTFTNIGKDIFPDTTEAMLDMSTALGQDLKASAVQLGKALNDPIKGVTALQKVGVTFTAEQKKQIAALVKAGQTAKAQKLILEELRREFGNSAKAAGQTLAGQMYILNNRIKNVKESIGTALLPGLTALANALGPVVTGAATAFGSWLATAGPKLATFANNVAGVVTAIQTFGLASPAAGQALDALFGGTWAQRIQDVGTWVGTAAGNLGNLKETLAATDWGSPETLLVLSDMFGPDWGTNIQRGVLGLQGIGDWLKREGPIVLRVAKEQFGRIKPDVLDAIKGGAETANKYLGDLKTTLGIAPSVEGWSGIMGMFRDLATFIDGLNTKLGNLIANINAALGAQGALVPTGQIGGTPIKQIPVPGVQWTPPKMPAGTGGRTHAGGTLWAPGGLSLVGERGPELVVLPGGSRVYNNRDTERLVGGGAAGASITIQQTFMGRADPAQVAQASRSGLLDAARSLGLV